MNCIQCRVPYGSDEGQVCPRCRAEEDADAAGSLSAAYFADPKPTKGTPLTITEEDAFGLRRVYGYVTDQTEHRLQELGEEYLNHEAELTTIPEEYR
jgi:hypothetical protein